MRRLYSTNIVRKSLSLVNWLAATLCIVSLYGLVGCRPSSVRLANLNERRILGPDLYTGLKWSADDQYLLFTTGVNFDLTLYDFRTEKTQGLGKRATRFAWTSNGLVSYLADRIDLSGNPYPEVRELHLINPDGTGDKVIAEDLYSATDFGWFKDRQRALILMTDGNRVSGEQDIYLLDIRTGKKEKFVSRQELDVREITEIAISPDETQIVIQANRGDPTLYSNVPFFVIIDLKTKHILQEIDWHDVFPPTTYGPFIRGGFGLGLNFVTQGEQRWIIASANIPEGQCYNYAVYFLNVRDRSKNFCIPSANGVISDISLSHALTRLAYLSVDGPGVQYITLADLTPEYRTRLEK